ncbi:Fic family protein [Arthrobacter sp. Hor0625]|uniref:Fic family protein n=1 Tax=Arthrobacter sp. Hor0625 TaxID=3457358 RepID=UPI00403E8E4D
MDIKAFEASPAGKLVPISGTDARSEEPWAHFAYVPNPLPPEVPLTPEAQIALGEADRALGALNAYLTLIPDPQWLVRPTLSKEAVSTSALEGTFASLEEVLEADYIDEKKSTAQVREVRNYLRAAERSLESLKTRPVCRSVLEELQGILVKGTRGETYDSGQLRKRQVFIGNHGRPVSEARFVPPPPGKVLEDGFSDWEKWINLADRVPLLIRVALGHYQFETLHPFADGNGRIGRLVMTLQLIESRVLDYPILNMASWLEPRREEYIDHLLKMSQTGDFDPWIRFFMKGVAEQSLATTKAIRALLQLKESMQQQLRDVKDKSIATSLAADLIGNPIFDVSSIARRYDVSPQAANNAVHKLLKLGLVEQVGQRTYGRLFVCNKAMRIMNSF